jgi:hypothetical protein
MGKNHVVVRFDNLGDRFDNNWDTFNIDVKKFASELYRQVNKGKLPQNIEIKELSLSGNQERAHLQKFKHRWLPRGDIRRSPQRIQLQLQEINPSRDVFKFFPQQIRTFDVVFNRAQKKRHIKL